MRKMTESLTLNKALREWCHDAVVLVKRKKKNGCAASRLENNAACGDVLTVLNLWATGNVGVERIKRYGL